MCNYIYTITIILKYPNFNNDDIFKSVNVTNISKTNFDLNFRVIKQRQKRRSKNISPSIHKSTKFFVQECIFR